MDDEEDHVFETKAHSWCTKFREIKCEHQGTQTPGPALVPDNGMLPCGVSAEPRQLFYGIELVEDRRVRQQQRQQQSEERQNRMERPPQQQPVVRDLEVCIGLKLQIIGDQFHEEYLQLYHRNQRNLGPLWGRLVAALLSLLPDWEFIAGFFGAGQR